jgi:bile acid:Na+ symporter, BASS family
MPSSIQRFIVDQFIVLMVAAFIIGMLFQPLAAALNPVILYLIMTVMYLSFLKMDFHLLSDEIKQWPIHLYLAITTLMIVPALVFYLCRFVLDLIGLDTTYAVGSLLLFSAPTAVLAATFTLLLKGKFERSLLSMVVTSFLAPLTMPFMLSSVAGSYVEFDYGLLTKTLFMVIVVPFLAATLTIKLFPKVKGIMSPQIPSISVILLVLVKVGALAGFRDIIFNDIGQFFSLLLLSFALLIVVFIFGWFTLWWASGIDKITTGLITTWSNMGLALGIGNMLFKDTDPEVVLFLTVAVLPWHLSLVLVKMLARKVVVNSP